MATTTWTGASSSVWATAGNWTNGAPATGDTAVIDGSVSITGGTGTQVERVYVAGTYTGAIGSAGTPLEIDSAELSVDNSSSGSTHYIHLTGANNATPTVMVDGRKTGNALYISGDLNILVIEPTFLGVCYLGNSASLIATVNNWVVLTASGIVSAEITANVAFATGATGHIASGTVNLGENFGTDGNLTVSGGTLNVSEWTVTTGDTLTQMGGAVNWNGGETGTSGTAVNGVNTLTLVDGTFTTASNEKAYVKFGQLTQYGGTINLQSSFPNISFTNFTSYAGSFSYPKQSVLTTTPK